MAMASSSAATVMKVGAISRSRGSNPTSGASKLRTASVCCVSRCDNSVKWQARQGQQCSGASSSCGESEKGGALAPAAKGAVLKLSAALVPMLAAALVGSVQPIVQASEWEEFLVPIDNEEALDEETLSGDDGSKDLLQRIKEKRAKRNLIPPGEEKSAATSPSFASQVFATPPPVSVPPQQIPDTEVTKSPPIESEVVAKVGVEKQKTHGLLPLFVAQFLLLLATFGGGFILLTTPQSKWDELNKKATAIVDDAWSKAKPVAFQANQKVQEFANASKPYLSKAWDSAKPLAAKAVEASKPILKGVQVKAIELLQKGKSKTQ